MKTYRYGMTPPFTGRNVPINELVEATGKSSLFIRLGLQKGILPFGYAYRMDDSSEFTYYCPDKRVWEETGYFAWNDLSNERLVTVYGKKS